MTSTRQQYARKPLERATWTAAFTTLDLREAGRLDASTPGALAPSVAGATADLTPPQRHLNWRDVSRSKAYFRPRRPQLL